MTLSATISTIAEAEAARTAVVQRGIVRAAAVAVRQPCIVVRLREREDVRREDGADAEPDRRTPRECLMIRSDRIWSSAKVIEALVDVIVTKGVPEHLRSGNGRVRRQGSMPMAGWTGA